MKNGKHRIGVIGAGARGETFARQLHEGTFRAELFGVCDIDADRLGKFCDYCQLGDTRRFTDPRQFFSEPDLDAVIITTPEFTHAEVAVQAMEAGKHVYIEKPLANTIEGCHKILRAQQRTGMTCYVGFNLRANPIYQKMHDLVASGMLGQVVHVSGMEILERTHGASFMRRFHRKSSQSGGLMNHKCCHDLDLILWFIGHQHSVRRVFSFGGTNVFTPEKAPAQFCHECPQPIYRACPYKAIGGFAFPASSPDPMYHQDRETYGGDLCVYNSEKDLVDNQTMVFEWDNGIRGNFNLQMFQAQSRRCTTIWGERGFIEYDTDRDPHLRAVLSDTGETIEYRIPQGKGGHGGTDPRMIARLIDAIENGGQTDSGLGAGLAVTVLAVKAEESRRSGQPVEVSPETYSV